MSTIDIIEGLTILEKYRDSTDGYNCGADYDIIYAYATDRPVEKEDLLRLIFLGWEQYCTEYDQNSQYIIDSYDPEESWHANV